MRGAEIKGKSRRQMRAGSINKTGKSSHFRTVRFGGFEETQIICYLWDVIKAVEAGAAVRAGASDRPDSLAEEARQLRMQMRVEMRRYFARRKRRNVRIVLTFIMLALSVICLFSFIIGVDRVSGESMYPYLNNGDWIIYSRLGGRCNRDEVVVFENGGENFVKRIVGLPGDTVEISESGNDVIVNGERIAEHDIHLTDAVQESSFAERKMTEKAGLTDGSQTSQTPFGKPLKMLDGQYMVLGDNRSVSIDSRDSRVGTEAQRDILGKVILVVRAR